MIVAVIIIAAVLSFKFGTVKAVESYFARFPVTYVATTTLNYMTPGTGTSTYVYNTWNIDKTDVFINGQFATSSSKINFQFEYSNNLVDWFGENGVTATSNILSTQGSTTLVHTWQPSSPLGDNGTATASSTRRIVVTFPDIASNFKRIVFSVPVGSGNASVWAEATAKSNAQ